MNPFFRTDFSISDSLKTVRKSVLIYETIIFNQYSEKQGDCSELFSYIKKLIKQDWSTQHKIDTAVKKFLLEKEAELNAGYKNDDNP